MTDLNELISFEKSRMTRPDINYLSNCSDDRKKFERMKPRWQIIAAVSDHLALPWNSVTASKGALIYEFH